MSKPKDLFLRNKKDVAAALAITKSDAFEKLMTFARAEFSTRNPTAEQGRGAIMFEEVLRNLPEDDVDDTTWSKITSGAVLNHELEIPIRHLEEQPQKQ